MKRPRNPKILRLSIDPNEDKIRMSITTREDLALERIKANPEQAEQVKKLLERMFKGPRRF